jgi:hypothetical protein
MPLKLLSCQDLEARPGIEPGYEDLQSSTSPFCHRAKVLNVQKTLES